MMKSRCDGCIQDWPLQCNHKCLTEAKTMATDVLDTLLKYFNHAEFMALLAAEARKQSVVLEMPHQTLKITLLFQLEAIKEELLEPLLERQC